MAAAYSVGAEGVHFQLPASAYGHGAFLHGEVYFHGFPHVQPAFEQPPQPELKQPRVIELPPLPGISALSVSEITRDLQEIEQSFVEEDDSDDSVVLEDILPSSYPVKPRKTPKWPPVGQTHTYAGEDEELEEEFGLEETMELFRIIEKVRPEIFESEREREAMEVQYQALRDAYVNKCREYGKAKRGQQNLIRVLQATAARKLAVVTAYHRQNAMMADVVKCFRWRMAAAEKLKESISATRRQFESVKKRGALPDDSINVLDVELYDGLHPEKPELETLTLYVGMVLETPYGEGVIETIRPRAQQVVLKLPYGTLHASIRNAVQWGPFDLASDTTLLARWDVLEQKLRMPASYEHLINTLLTKTSTEDDLLTDKDEDTGPEDEMDVAAASVASGDEAEPASSGSKTERKRKVHEHDWAKDIISREHAMLPVAAEGIPLLLAPAATMPTIIQDLRTQHREHLSAVRAALLPSSEASVQAKEAMRMRAEFTELTKQIQQLRAEHTLALHRIERNRQQTARTTQQITALRTEMLTRRQRHRSVLADHGVQEGHLPAAFTAHAKEDDSPAEGQSSIPSNPIDILAALAAPDAPTKRKTDTSDGQESRNGAKSTKRRRA